MNVLLLARHGQSLFNVDHLVNGDPALDRGLSPLGVEQAHALARQLVGTAIELCVVSTFPRAQQTASLALGDRADTTPRIVDSDLDDVRIGELEGHTLDDYRAWKENRTHDDRFPGGESLNEAAHRYAAAYRRILERPGETILCVCHEIPVRYAVNAAAGSNDLDHPLHDVANATPYVFDTDGLRRAIDQIEALSAS